MTIDLKLILQQHPECLAGRLSFRAVMKDHYPEEDRMIHLLTILYDCGILKKLETATMLTAETVGALVSLAESKYGVSPQYTAEAVEVWAAAYGVAVEHPTPLAPQEAPTPTPGTASISISKPTPTKPTGATFSTPHYDLIEKTDGWYVAKFKGTDVDYVGIDQTIEGHSIVGIAEGAFADRIDLRTVRLRGVKVIEDRAFCNCPNLSVVDLCAPLFSIGEEAFMNTGLRFVSPPNSVTYIGPRAFAGCTDLLSVTMPDATKTVEVGLFAKCSKLSNVTFSRYQRRIRTAAFDGCRSLDSLVLPEGIKTIEKDAFRGSGLRSITIPETATSIGLECGDPHWFDDARALANDETLGLVGKIKCKWNSCAHRYAESHNIKAKTRF